MTLNTEHSTEPELLFQLEKAHEQVEVGALYTHYRTETSYKVLNLAIIEATQEVAVIYQAASNPLKSVTWIRPLSSFLEKIYIGDIQVNRFQKKSLPQGKI